MEVPMVLLALTLIKWRDAFLEAELLSTLASGGILIPKIGIIYSLQDGSQQIWRQLLNESSPESQEPITPPQMANCTFKVASMYFNRDLGQMVGRVSLQTVFQAKRTAHMLIQHICTVMENEEVPWLHT
jgi:hypothetical protein